MALRVEDISVRDSTLYRRIFIQKIALPPKTTMLAEVDCAHSCTLLINTQTWYRDWYANTIPYSQTCKKIVAQIYSLRTFTRRSILPSWSYCLDYSKFVRDASSLIEFCFLFEEVPKMESSVTWSSSGQSISSQSVLSCPKTSGISLIPFSGLNKQPMMSGILSGDTFSA